jgi:vacuolar-type H+-ATPase subunit H
MTDTVGNAMRQVLSAESAAAQQLARCQHECQAALDAARVDARRIAERAEAIAQAIHGRIDKVASERAECRLQAAEHAPDAPDEARVTAAIVSLAARLTGEAQ